MSGDGRSLNGIYDAEGWIATIKTLHEIDIAG
jgi:hypothetical protein